MTRERPVAPDLFETGPAGLRLVGGRRKSDGKIVFPLPSGGERQLHEPILLSPRGTLWSWTVQRFRPKTPPYGGQEGDGDFRPFCLGYVELPGEIIVEARLAAEPGALKIGIAMEAVAIPFATDPDGTVVLTFGFRPSAGEAHSGAAA